MAQSKGHSTNEPLGDVNRDLRNMRTAVGVSESSADPVVLEGSEHVAGQNVEVDSPSFAFALANRIEIFSLGPSLYRLAVLSVLVIVSVSCSSPTPSAQDIGTSTIPVTPSVSESGVGEQSNDPVAAVDPECIAPANPGGGFALTCGAVASVLEQLELTPEVLVTYQPGAGGGVAFANVQSERSNDENLLVAASPGTSLRLAQGQYAGFDEFDVRWVASTAVDHGVLAVRPDSDLVTLDDLIEALESDAGSIRFGGGSAVGGQDHMKVLLLAEAIGIDPLEINYRPFEGGGVAMSALETDFIDVFPGDVSEVVSLHERDEIRVIATLTEERLEGRLPDVPTASEQGLDITWETYRGFWAPPGISDEAYAFWVDTLTELSNSPEWASVAAAEGLDVHFIGGSEFERLVHAQVNDFRELSRRVGLTGDRTDGS